MSRAARSAFVDQAATEGVLLRSFVAFAVHALPLARATAAAEQLAGVNREAREAAKKFFLASDASMVHLGAGPRFGGA
jgi:hypothetical protein